MILKLSWRNVWRSRTRSLVIILAIAIGLTGGVFSVALFNGMTDQKMRSAIDTQTAHIQLHKEGFSQNKDINLDLPLPQDLEEKIERIPFVKAVSQRVVSTAMLASSNASTGVELLGIDPEKEKQISSVYEKLEEGTYFEDVKRNPILISRKTADKLEIKLRSKVVVTFQNADGTIVGAAFRVVGIFRTSSSAFDEATAYVRGSDLAGLLNMPGSKHEIVVKGMKMEDVPSIYEAIKKEVPSEVKVESWKEIQPELGYLGDLMMQMNFLFLAIILFALAFGILNTMLMAVFERVREIGVLMAVGMNKGKIFRMIVVETVLLSFIGAMIGLALSMLLVTVSSSSGIDLSMFAEGFASWGIDQVVYPYLSPDFYFTLVLMVIFTALVSSVYPALKALKLRPVDAIKGNVD
ncbi:FtsX-like permease family protein [Flammeovirgaceae bacterium SG7u.111]|nr:FtsX-like permease family protein [Flammeovirgaceae bacterium SG7u.132]WPO36504.1 FtsX-like permease family protein [Flammeovirgaceae bacterium SG7u.111]